MAAELKRAGWAVPGLALLLLVGAARADESGNPFVVPQHDVDVVYEVPPPPGVAAGRPLLQRVRFQAATERQRLDPPAGGSFMVTDYRARTLTVVEPVRRTATTVPAPGPALAPPGVRATGRFDRLGDQRIAGLTCTEWRTRDDNGADSVLCLTADGVMLQARHGDQVLVRARTVSLAPQPDATFAVPEGFRAATPPPPR